MLISKKRLLNWMTADEAAKVVKTNLTNTVRQFWLNYVLAFALLVYSLVFNQLTSLNIGIILMFVVGPIIIYLVSKPLDAKTGEISEENKTYINNVAEKTWRFLRTLN